MKGHFTALMWRWKDAGKKFDLNKSVDKEKLQELRDEMDVKLENCSARCKEENKIPVVIVFDGFGAGGRGNADQPPVSAGIRAGFDVYARPGDGGGGTDASISLAVLDEDTGKMDV